MNDSTAQKLAHRYMQKQFRKMVNESCELWPFLNMSNNPCLSINLIRDCGPSINKWNWYAISRNPGIYEDDIEKSLDFPWVWDSTIFNPNLTPEFYLRHNDKYYDQTLLWSIVSTCKHITIDFVKNNNSLPWDWIRLTSNLSISLEDIERYPDLSWDFVALSNRRSDTSTNDYVHVQSVNEFDFANVKKEHFELFDWKAISSNINLTIDFVIENSNLSWDFKELASNYFTKQFNKVKKSIMDGDNTYIINEQILMTIEQKYQSIIMEKLPASRYKDLPRSKYITVDFIKSHPEIEFDSGHLSSNPNLTMKDVRELSTLKWDYNVLTTNPGISLNDIDQNPTLPWFWNVMHERKDLTIDFLRKYSNRDWDWCSMFSVTQFAIDNFNELVKINDIWATNIPQNPNVTMDFIANHPYLPWNFGTTQIKDITSEFINANDCVRWNWEHIFKTTDIEPEVITVAQKNQGEFWKFVPYSSKFTCEFFEANKHQFTSWSILSQHAKCITPEYVRANPYLPWDWIRLASNPNFTPSTVNRNMEGKYIFDRILHKGTIEEIRQFMNEPKLKDKLNWDIITFLTRQKSVEIILDNPDLPWDWKNVY